MRKPVITVSVPNDQKKFEDDCEKLRDAGYSLLTASCTSHSYEGAIDEIWMAVFVLPSAKI